MSVQTSMTSSAIMQVCSSQNCQSCTHLIHQTFDWSSLGKLDELIQDGNLFLPLQASARVDQILRQADLDMSSGSTESYNNTRVKSLAKFQKRALQHALSFPKLKKLVYSTCSVKLVRMSDAIGNNRSQSRHTVLQHFSTVNFM